jgi:hypothetical protein
MMGVPVAPIVAASRRARPGRRGSRKRWIEQTVNRDRAIPQANVAIGRAHPPAAAILNPVDGVGLLAAERKFQLGRCIDYNFSRRRWPPGLMSASVNVPDVGAIAAARDDLVDRIGGPGWTEPTGRRSRHVSFE